MSQRGVAHRKTGFLANLKTNALPLSVPGFQLSGIPVPHSPPGQVPESPVALDVAKLLYLSHTKSRTGHIRYRLNSYKPRLREELMRAEIGLS